MEEEKRKPGRLARLGEYAGGRRGFIHASMVLSALSAAVSVVPFYYIWLMLDEVLRVMPDYGQATGLAHNGWMALGFTVLSVMLYIAALMLSHMAAFRIAKNLRKAIVAHAAELPPGAFDSMGSGKVRRIIQDSVGSTETYLAHNLPDMAGSTVLPIAMLAMLFVFDWRLGLSCIAVFALAALVMLSMVGSRAMKESMDAYQGALGDVNREAVEYVRGISVVKTFQQTVESFQTFRDSILRYGEFVINYTRWCRGRMCLFVVASNSAFALIIATAFAVTGMDWSAEFLADFLFYVIFSPLIAVLLMRVMFASNEGYVVDDALSRIDSILAMEPLSEPAEPRMPDGTTVRFESVTFTYPESDRPAVDSFTLEMKPGTITALVGPSGSGKSTVAVLACRFWDPDRGSITIGGIDLRDIGTANLGSLMSFVFQTNHLLKGTIRSNVLLGRPDATDEEVSEALHLAQCDDIVAKLPDGLDTKVGPGGVYLSGGEVQRIAIARAILKDSPIVILDEATAFADPENEYLVQRAFENLSEGKTVLMIAHRLTTVRDADCICVMENGRMVEIGTHPELVASGGRYGRMWGDYQKSLSWRVSGASS
ncbi:MAG: ABC transporter ATP-binding protein [Thermoplasmata archaeon]|nr:ABC transporter ATP-binding protein [Thermoplasmata archaeon]